MKELVKNTDYNSFLDLLIQQYKDKTKFNGILQGVAEQCNDVETAIFEIKEEFDLETAIGVQLNIIGDIQGEDRQGKNDTDYRDAIKVRVILNSGSGEPEILIKAIKDVYGATLISLKNIGIATVEIWANILLTSAQYDDLLKLTPAGVQLIVVSGSNNPFVFLGDSDGSGFTKLSDDDYYLFDTNGDKVLDTDGNAIIVFVNEPNLDYGGEFQNVWM